MYIKSTIPAYLYYTYVYYLSKSVPCFTQLISQPRHPVLAAMPMTCYCWAGTFHPCTHSVVQPHLPAQPPSPQPEAMAKVPVSSVLWVQGLWAGEAGSLRARGGIGAVSHLWCTKPWDLDVPGLCSSSWLLLEQHLFDTGHGHTKPPRWQGHQPCSWGQ